MIAASIGLILIVTGAGTAAAGLAAALFPRVILQYAFDVTPAESSTLFFTRHWGLLIFLVGALLVACANVPQQRAAILIAAAVEKLVLVGLVFFGPLKRTLPMTAIALADGTFALLYVAYLAGL